MSAGKWKDIAELVALVAVVGRKVDRILQSK